MTKAQEPKALRARAAALRSAADVQRVDNAAGNSPVEFGKAFYEMTVQGLDREAAKLEAEADQLELDNTAQR